ncbi:hypothetical protein Nepgr_022322 [Nepenthes gracilis]|uniref:Nodulin-like domain-containing protein n=1 Tax=Nepenthes gracilis TaxID=150966 RepID=A0AAD3T2D0_NEPGR|nr:hypothetical protein Nepgr_022322 [Nepenthes gracilis]
MPSTALQWFSLVAVILLQSINGTNLNFPAYSSELKRILSLTQLQVNNLAFANDAGKLAGWISGIAALYLPLWLVLMIGLMLGLIGYGIPYLFLSHQNISLSYWQLFFLTVLAGNSICWINTISYIVTIRNFPLQRQAAVGLTTSYISLSPVIYTAIVNALSSLTFEKAEEYLLLNAVLPSIFGVIAMPFLREIDTGKAKQQEAGFIAVSIITIATGTYAIVSSLGSIASRLSPLINLIGIGLCLLAPIVVPLAECVRAILKPNFCTSKEEDAKEADGAVEIANKEVESSPMVATMDEIGVKSMFKRLNFWLYFFVYFLGATLGLVYLNNLGQIAQSRGFSHASSLVSFSSAFGFFGRLLPCFQHYIYSRSRRRVPGPASIMTMTVPISGAFFLLLNGTNVSLYMSTAIIGACTGAITSVSVSVTTDLFGAKNFGVNHNVVVANIPIGSSVFGDLAALLYRRESHGHPTCMGLDCYRDTFIIWGCLSSLGSVLALILHLRSRKFYLDRLY